jgi:SAM-dependent methyltransferase
VKGIRRPTLSARKVRSRDSSPVPLRTPWFLAFDQPTCSYPVLLSKIINCDQGGTPLATILRDWSYRYQWLYDAIASVSAIAVGGSDRFRRLALQGLEIDPDACVLDLCCGSGQATQYLATITPHVIGLDASPRSIQRAQRNVPQATFVEGWAERMPFDDESFDLVHTSAALHEMEPNQLRQILKEVYRVLKPGGIFALVDFHAPHNPLFVPALSLFLLLFETETAWELIHTDLPNLLSEFQFEQACVVPQNRSKAPTARLYAGGSLQVIHAYKP